MSKHVLNTRLAGAVREGGRECVRRNAIVPTPDTAISMAAAADRARRASDEPFIAKFGNSAWIAVRRR